MNSKTSKTTLVIGASEKPHRYSNMAMRLLKMYGHKVIAIGNKTGVVDEIPIETASNCDKNSQVDTITLYLNPDNQIKYYNQILEIHPQRVVFNPGSENPELQAKLDEHKIPWEESCTLVLLRSGQY